ncbi:hypothetical protein EJ05DRAFT_65646 [Pseudovirgaria hyperparasitica]|uniref:Fe2OG dioxygenase domain-containing protein n=1 Tax=Pseudovirgaria hyperparasitica TaxID=470096 RepID=A0A6A6W0P9_9PEZI|nr:uncharacterized protein EJ05DRAFT_65646 [Pseudovirgaria hyperparasitica]KAF2756472.1 hypothetical protein EJ05DRAFT_65646 [Pseudovirgaria hyperparasitica]
MAITKVVRDRLKRNSKFVAEDALPPLRNVELPKVKPAHQPALAGQGWTTITFDGPEDTLKHSLDQLFDASKAFFALPQEYKASFLTTAGSEEGWNRIEGEKEFITLRTIDNTPKELKSPAIRAWAEAGQALNAILEQVAKTLDLPPEALTQYSEPCIELNGRRTATMLRLFRYEGHEQKVVAEPHADLGLLSFVMGDTPGLEVWNKYHNDFWPIEKTYKVPQGTILGGRQLQRLSNERYEAGGHLVRSYGLPHESPITAAHEKPYRYSIVFVLRAHSPILVDTDKLTTSITGPFKHPLRDMTAGQLFQDTKRKHFNINTGTEEREKQKLEIIAKRQAQFLELTARS